MLTDCFAVKQDHHFNKLGRAHSPKATAPVQDPRSVAILVLEKTVSKGVIQYMSVAAIMVMLQ